MISANWFLREGIIRCRDLRFVSQTICRIVLVRPCLGPLSPSPSQHYAGHGLKHFLCSFLSFSNSCFLHGLKPSTGYNANCHKHQNFCNDIRIRGERKDASFSHSVLWNSPFKNSIFVFPHYVSHSPQGLGGEWSVAYLSTTVYILFLILGGFATSTSSCWTPQWRMGWRARWFLCSKNWVQVGCCRT